jgi:bifunctional DNA-binding transcriptional regulator/antitoxin component of YhaV-PrlF toxin-antitoxin module
MSNYKRKEVMDYLTRKPTTVQDIELARTRIQTPVTPLSMPVASNEGLETREGFKDGNFARGFEHKSFIPLTKEQREIVKKVYGVKESEVDDWQINPENKAKKKNITRGSTTLETKAANLNPDRIIVSAPKGSEKINDVIFPDKKTEKSFLKDLKERFTLSQGQSEKNIKYFSENYPISERQATRAIKFLSDKYKLKYSDPLTKPEIREKLKNLREVTSDITTEDYITKKIKQPILKEKDLVKKIDLAHRVSKEHMKQLGLQFSTRTTGFDSRLINQVIIRPSEDALEKLYRKQRNIIDDIKQNGLTEELSGKLEDINNKVRIEAKKTNGRLIGVTVDPETLDVSFEGKKAKLGLTDKVLDIKEIAEMSPDKKVKFLTNQITPRIQAEIDRGFTPNDFKEILSDSKREKSLIKYAEKYTPDIVEDVKKIIKNPTSTKSLPLYTDPTGLGNFLETSVGQGLSKSAPNLLKTTAKLSAITGTPINALLGVALYADEFKEKGLGDLETIAAGAYKGSTQDLLNFGDLIFRKLPVATYEKFVEDKPFLESLLDKPEYFEFADKQIDKYASEKSIKDRIQNMAEYEVRKSVIPNVSDTEVPTTTTSEEYKNLVQNKVGEILNLNPDLKKQYKQETTLVPEPKKDPSQNLMLGPIVFPKYTQEELNFARGGRVKFASGSEDPESDLYIPPLDKSEETSKEGIYNTKRLGPEDSLSKYKSYSEEELLGNIEAKYPNQLQSFSLEDYQLNTMPIFKPKDVAPPKSYSPMPNIYNERKEGILELATGGRVGFKDGQKDPNKLIPIDPLLQDQSPTDPGRRDVLKLGIAGAGLLGLGKLGLLKLGSVAKPSIIAEAVKGTTAPSWMEGLMTKILKEGTEIKMPKESSIIKKEVQFKNPETGDVQTATLTIDSKSDRMFIEYDSPTNVANQPVVLELYRERKIVPNPGGESNWFAPDKTKGYNFYATETGPRVVDWDGNIEFDAEDTVRKIIDLKSDISGLKSYATEGKGINKKVAQEKRAATADIEKNPEQYVPDWEPEIYD